MPELLGCKRTGSDASSLELVFAAEIAHVRPPGQPGFKCWGVMDDRCRGPASLLLATPCFVLPKSPHERHWGKIHLRRMDEWMDPDISLSETHCQLDVAWKYHQR